MITTENHICPINGEQCREDCAWNVNEKRKVKSGSLVKTTKPLCAVTVISDSFEAFVRAVMEDAENDQND